MVWGKLFRPCSCSCIGPFWWDSYQPDWVCEGCFQISLLIQSQFKHDGLIGENIGEADDEGKEKQTWKNSQISVFFISIGTFPSPIDLSNIIGHITQTLLVISPKHCSSSYRNQCKCLTYFSFSRFPIRQLPVQLVTHEKDASLALPFFNDSGPLLKKEQYSLLPHTRCLDF